MQCPKCGQTNPEAAKFCTRCHTPLRFECPACKHVQSHGGTCDHCGVDFAKYLGLLMFQAKSESDKKSARIRKSSGWLKQILLLPITGGLSLFKFLFRRE